MRYCRADKAEPSPLFTPYVSLPFSDTGKSISLGMMQNRETLDTGDINTALRKSRKIREPKACYPCRRRKVKCSNQIPCANCIARNHANLCTYDERNNAKNSAQRHSRQVRMNHWTLCILLIDGICQVVKNREAISGRLNRRKWLKSDTGTPNKERCWQSRLEDSQSDRSGAARGLRCSYRGDDFSGCQLRSSILLETSL